MTPKRPAPGTPPVETHPLSGHAAEVVATFKVIALDGSDAVLGTRSDFDSARALALESVTRSAKPCGVFKLVADFTPELLTTKDTKDAKGTPTPQP